MRFLLLTTKFNHIDKSPWLASELVDELLRLGHVVTVINIDWAVSNNSSYEYTNKNGFSYKYLTPFVSSIPRLGLSLKWIFSSLKAYPYIIKLIFRGSRFDLCIGFSPCTATYAIHPLLKLLSKKSLLIYWDFFPIHNQQILHSIPNCIIPLLRWVENKCIQLYDNIGFMSPQSVNFAKKYFILEKKQNNFILPIWTTFLKKPTKSSSLRCELGLSKDRIVIVFGGQLAPGRGVLELCNAVIDSQKINSNIALIVIGDGVLSSRVKIFSQLSPDVIFCIGRVERSRYLEILSDSDVGVVATVSGVSSPTFPSKCLDYMACELPILASLEPATDFGEIVVNNAMGISCVAGDHDAMVAAILVLANDPIKRKKMGKKGSEYLHDNHSVSKICDLICKLKS
jgi:glycosyltransferase involved in cell wall biosynthesis